jgi:hypothetical protein
METKKVKYSEWMDDSASDNDNWDRVFSKEKFDQGGKGHMLL